MPAAAASTRNGYRPALGSGTRRMNVRRPNPQVRPTAAPTVISMTNSTAPAVNAPDPLAVSNAAISAMPTGSLTPDSPSRIVPDLPTTSRRPSTENTTAGSVGASAVPISNAACQPKPNNAGASTPSR